MSNEIRVKFERYKALVQKDTLMDDDYAEIARLEMTLDKIPDFLSVEFATEYRRLQLEFDNNVEDADG